MCQHGLGAAFYAKRAAKTAHQKYVILKAFETFAKVSEDAVQTLDFSGTLRQQSSGELLEFM